MADIKEQLAVDAQESNRLVMEGQQAGMWTALPAIINGFDPVAMTVSCTPSIQGIITDRDGVMSHVTITQLVDVPVVFPRGGGFSLTFPITSGDECLVVFSSRCIDGWWQSGQIAPQTDRRMHDLSDGFALVGPYSQVKRISNVSTGSVQLRSDDGNTYVEVTHDGILNIVAPVKVTLAVPVVDVTETLTVGNGATGTFTAASGQTVTVVDGVVTNIF